MKFCPQCKKEYEKGGLCPEDGSELKEKVNANELPPGTVFKKSYCIEEKLTEGRIGTVYRGVQQPLGQRVAIKVMDADELPALVERFNREAEILATLNHPNVVRLIDYGETDEGFLYIVMEHLDGQSLFEAVPRRTPLPLDEIISLMDEICAGVQAAHMNGLVHRDLKPSNLFLAETSDGGEVLKILNFGVAKRQDKTLERLTLSGTIMGTSGYVAPELITGDGQPSPQSDIYALGSVLYFMLTGHSAYDGPSAKSIFYRQLTEPPPPFDYAQAGYPPELQDVVLKAMATLPEDRYTSVKDLTLALHKIVGGDEEVVEEPEASNAANADTADTQDMDLKQQTDAASPVDPSAETKLQTPLLSTPSKRRGPEVYAAAAVAVAAVMGLLWWTTAQEEAAVEGSQEPVANAGAASAGTSLPIRGVAADKITFGMTGAFSGPNKLLGRDIRMGIEAMFRSVNDRGGVSGRKLELAVSDDGYEPARAKSNTEDLTNKQQVFAVIGTVGGPSTKAAMEVVQKENTLLFGPFSGASWVEDKTTSAFVLNYRARLTQEVEKLLAYLIQVKKIGASNIVVFAQADSLGEEGVEATVMALKKYANTDKVTTFESEPGVREVSAAVESFARHPRKIDAVLIFATYRPAAQFIAEAKQKRPNSLFATVSLVGSRGLSEHLLQNSPEAAEGVLVTQVVPHYDSQSTGVRRYRAALEKYYPAQQPSFVSLEGFIVASILVEGLNKAGRDFNRDSLLKTFESIPQLDLGFGPICRYTSGQHQCSDKVWGTVLDAEGKYSIIDLES